MDWHPEHWANIRILDRSLIEWIVALAVLILVAGGTRALQGFVVSRLSKTSTRTATKIDDVFVSLLRGTKAFFHLALGVAVAQRFLRLEEGTKNLVHIALTLILVVQVGIWGNRAASGVIGIWATGRDRGQDATMAAGLNFLARLVIWLLVVLVALSNLGIELSAVIAGLGVGGVAAALAVQSTLGDLFAGVSMYFDRPFDIGDFVVIDDLNGTVTKIGIKTTRIKTLSGEELILPNGEIAKSRIRNFARMLERRIVFKFGIEYGLPAAKVERAREIAADVIRSREGVRLDRVHFVAFGSSSLDFEIVYFVLSPDYNTYLDHQQAINLEIYRQFEQADIGFAFPTQTLHIPALAALREAAGDEAAGDEAADDEAAEDQAAADAS